MRINRKLTLLKNSKNNEYECIHTKIYELVEDIEKKEHDNYDLRDFGETQQRHQVEREIFPFLFPLLGWCCLLLELKVFFDNNRRRSQ